MPSSVAVACFLPDRAKDLSAPLRMYVCTYVLCVHAMYVMHVYVCVRARTHTHLYIYIIHTHTHIRAIFSHIANVGYLDMKQFHDHYTTSEHEKSSPTGETGQRNTLTGQIAEATAASKRRQ